MNVGYFKHKTVKDQNGVEQKFIGGMINIPFMRPIECSLIITPPEELAGNQKAPIYKIALYKPKGWEVSRQIIGGIWSAVSKDGKVNYFKGHIETPLVAGGRVYIALFEPKEDNGLMFEVTWSAPKSNTSAYVPTASNEDASYYADDDAIPY